MPDRPLTIPALKKLDNYLLAHKPEIWSARTHLVVWYGLLYSIVLSLLCYVLATDPRLPTNVYIWTGFVAALSIVFFVVWIIYLVRFNVFKRYGITSGKGRVITFLLYFMNCAMIAGVCYIPLLVETFHARQIYSQKMLIDDVNAINTRICQLEYNQIPKAWRRDTLYVLDSVQEAEVKRQEEHPLPQYRTDSIAVSKVYSAITQSELRGKKIQADSLEIISDSLVVELTAPDISFLENYFLKEDSLHEMMNSKMLYKRVFVNFVQPDKTVVTRELHALMAKYYLFENDNNTYIKSNDLEDYKRNINVSYQLRAIDQGIDNICRKANRFGQPFDFIRQWLYYSFFAALLLFVFRHSTVRTFFLSLLVLLLIFIGMSLIAAFAGQKSISFYWWCIIYFALFSLIMGRIFKSKKRSIVQGIALNLWVLVVPFIPFFVAHIYYGWKSDQDMLNEIITYNTTTMWLVLDVAEIAGPVIFLVLLATYIHALYKTWYALQEE